MTPNSFVVFFVAVLVLTYVLNVGYLLSWARAHGDAARRRRRLALVIDAAILLAILSLLLARMAANIAS